MDGWMNMKKTISAVLAVTIVAASLLGMTACSKSDNKTKLSKNKITQVEENSEWFDYTESEITLDEKYIAVSINSQTVKTSDGYALALEASYKTDDIQSGLITDFGIRYDLMIAELNRDGSIKNLTVITPDMVGLNNKYDCSIKDVSSYNGDILCLVDGGFFDEETYSYNSQSVLYNFTQKKPENISCITNTFGDSTTLDYATYSTNGYLIATSTDLRYNSVLYIAKDGNLLGTFNISDLIPGFFYISKVITKGDIITVECTDESGFYVNFNIDTTNLMGTPENTGRTVPLAYTSLWRTDYYDENGSLIEIKSDGIYNGTNLVCDFSDSYCNPALAKTGCIVDATDDHYAILLDFNDISTYQTRIYFLTFDKASSNPNAGKTILTAGFTGDIDFSIGTAISEFNKTNSDYFVVAKSYTLNDDEEDSIELAVNQNASAAAIITNNLMMDMLNGDGPDILINTGNYSQFNSDEYLMDLSSFIDNEFADGILFDNVIEASKTDGKLYQIPTTFSVNGILLDSKDASGKVGFTFDEYDAYVSGACNGSNPIAPDGGRLDAFNALYPTMSELMYDKDGNVDFENGVFEQIASYCLNSIGQKPNGFVAPSSAMDGMTLKLNSFVQLSNISLYLFSNPMRNDVSLVGIPSVDGRGPSITANSSVAISVSCCDEDGAKAFVKSLLTNEKNYSQVFENPILVSATKDLAAKVIAFYNKNYETEVERNAPESEMNALGIYYYDPALVDSYIAILKTASCSTSADMNILVIIDEEIQAYFAGQKSIDDVISIIQSRAQTVVDER